MNDLYILDKGRNIVKCNSIEEWGKFLRKSLRRVGATKIGAAQISTVFLGLDHRFDGNGPPILFETMVFGGAHDEYQERCCTWNEAVAMHARVCNLVRETS